MDDSRLGALSEEDKESSSTPGEPETTKEESSDGAGPPFPFDADNRWSIYPRQATKMDFEDAVDLDIVRTLREHGVRDLEQREVHDAMVWLAAEKPDEIADRILAERHLKDGSNR